MIKTNFINNLIYEKIIEDLQPIIDNASTVFVSEITKYANPFTPNSGGALLNSMRLVKEGNRYIAVKYNVAYAARIYYGLEGWGLKKDTHPNASLRWLHRALDIYKKKYSL